MRSVKITAHLPNGSETSWKTSINGTVREIRDYFLRNTFNIGHEKDLIVAPFRLDFLDGGDR